MFDIEQAIIAEQFFKRLMEILPWVAFLYVLLVAALYPANKE